MKLRVINTENDEIIETIESEKIEIYPNTIYYMTNGGKRPWDNIMETINFLPNYRIRIEDSK